MLFPADNCNGHKPAGQLERRRNGLLQPRRDTLLDQQPVHHDFNGVILALVERRNIVERNEFTVDARPHVPVLGEFFQFFAIRAFSPPHDGRQNHDALVGLADFSLQDGLHNLLAGLPSDGLAAVRTMRHANRRVHHAQVIVNFRDGADCGTRRARGGFLLDRDGRRKALDHIHFWTFHLIQKLARIRGKRFDVAPLPLCINGVKR